MPRGPGQLYRSLAMELRAAAWRAERLLRGRARISVDEAPVDKEVHVLVGRECFSVKVVERNWYTPPSLLYRYAVSLLKHARERARAPYLVLVVPRLTRGAVRLVERRLRRWVRVIPYRVHSPRAIAYWLLNTILEHAGDAIARRREKGIPTGWLEAFTRAVAMALNELGPPAAG